MLPPIEKFDEKDEKKNCKLILICVTDGEFVVNFTTCFRQFRHYARGMATKTTKANWRLFAPLVEDVASVAVAKDGFIATFSILDG